MRGGKLLQPEQFLARRNQRTRGRTEADAAASLYRFGATTAYYEIVLDRIRSLNEISVLGYETLSSLRGALVFLGPCAPRP
ncbi:DUF3422 family protein [Rhizobium leguminosarum]|uniref:DUF3422 family protein n=1 Tax=Rhizobium leguminosarum TaxID=384 RepID=UPI0032AEFF05